MTLVFEPLPAGETSLSPTEMSIRAAAQAVARERLPVAERRYSFWKALQDGAFRHSDGASPVEEFATRRLERARREAVVCRMLLQLSPYL